MYKRQGYEYALIDNWWDTNIGRDRMKSLIEYARSKGVELFLWYSSSGYWNDIEQGPVNHMDNAITVSYTHLLFVYFTGNRMSEEAVRMAVSLDGYNYKALNGNQPVLDSRVISSTGGVRDPHILRCEDGKTFYMVVTDMVSGNGWSSNPVSYTHLDVYKRQP